MPIGVLMIERTMERHILEWAKKLPVIAILGPRQSDKNDTFKKKLFPSTCIYTLEDLKT